MKRFSLIALVFALGLFTVVPAESAIFSWDIAPSPNDQVSIKLQNWEPSVADVTSGGFLFGVLRVTEIINLTTGQQAWAATPGVDEITGIFHDYVYSASSTATNLLFTGGSIDLYFDDSPETNGTALANKVQGTNAVPDGDGGIWTDGQKLMTLLGNAGVAAAGGPFTLSTDLLTQSGRGFLDVLPGSGYIASDFDNNAFPTDIGTFADFNLHVTLQPATGAPAGNYQIFSNDPINSQIVPEPFSAFIWCGIAAISFGGLYVRRFRA